MNIKGISGKGSERKEGCVIENEDDPFYIMTENWLNLILQLCGKQNLEAVNLIVS